MNNIIKLAIKNKTDLLTAYIQQFKHGGMFVKGNFQHTLKDEVFLIITLPEEGDVVAVSGRIEWLSPASAVGYPVGIGVQFNNDQAGRDAKSRIEVLLGGLIADQHSSSYTF